LPESIEAAWPLAIVPTSVLHLIRNTYRLASRAGWDMLAATYDPSTPLSAKPTARWAGHPR
jgi:transposase-like protein